MLYLRHVKLDPLAGLARLKAYAVTWETHGDLEPSEAFAPAMASLELTFTPRRRAIHDAGLTVYHGDGGMELAAHLSETGISSLTLAMGGTYDRNRLELEATISTPKLLTLLSEMERVAEVDSQMSPGLDFLYSPSGFDVYTDAGLLRWLTREELERRYVKARAQSGLRLSEAMGLQRRIERAKRLEVGADSLAAAASLDNFPEVGHA